MALWWHLLRPLSVFSQNLSVLLALAETSKPVRMDKGLLSSYRNEAISYALKRICIWTDNDCFAVANRQLVWRINLSLRETFICRSMTLQTCGI